MIKTNLEAFRGDTTHFEVTTTRDQAPIDLTGATVTMTARRTMAASSIVFSRTSAPGGGITITDAPAGELTVVLKAEDTSSLPNYPVTLIYDIQVEEADGRITTVVWGDLVVYPDVTRG